MAGASAATTILCAKRTSLCIVVAALAPAMLKSDCCSFLFMYVRLVVNLRAEMPVSAYQIIYQRHAVERMAQRGIREEDIEHVLLTGRR